MRHVITFATIALAALGGANSVQGQSPAKPPGFVARPMLFPNAPTPEQIATAREERLVQQYFADHGFTVTIHADAEGDQQELQERLAARLSFANPIPEVRQEYFNWILEWHPDFRFTGWQGRIREVWPMGSGFMVTLGVSPYTASPFGGAISTPDEFYETYIITSAGHVHLIDHAGKPGPKMLTL